MKVITCASYYGTGSSAVTDFFSEFSKCSCNGSYEFRFIHDPDGVRDLEYHLIENNNRHNTNHAIKRFLKYAKFLNGDGIRKCYHRYLGDAFLKYTYDFVDQITELKCNTWWHYDQIEKGLLFYYIDNIYSRLCRMIPLKKRRIKPCRYSLLEAMHEPSYYSAINRETFYKYTREYISKVLNAMNKQHTEYLMVDQLLPPSNLNQYLNYFDDIKVIVSDRDPRDLFISANEFYGEKVIPHTNVEEFCKWYQITRRHRKTEVYNSEKVLFLRFEDLIYRYEETRKKLIYFVGLELEDHDKKGQYLNPLVSINNTNLKEKFPKYRDEVAYIEEHLEEYLYDFKNVAEV